MRILKANNNFLDIDAETAIGIDYQCYDFKKAGDIKINISNTFSIPRTSKNLKIFGFAGSAYSLSAIEYEKIYIDYFINNKQFVKAGVARVEKIEGGRIHLFVAERPAFIDEMKTTDLNSFISDWFNDAFDNEEFSTFDLFINTYKNGRDGVIMPLIAGNLSLYKNNYDNMAEVIGVYNESEYSSRIAMGVFIDTNNTVMSSRFAIFIDKLFNHIETFFNVDLSSSGTEAYNLFNDNLLGELSIPVRNLFYKKHLGDRHTLSFIEDSNSNYNFSPHEDLHPYAGLTVYDFFITTLRLLGYAMEPLLNGKYEIVRLDRLSEVKGENDFLPGYMAEGFSDMEYVPNIENYGVNNIIKMKPYSDGGENLGAKTIINANKNLDQRKDLFKVNAYIPPFLRYGNTFVPDLSDADSFNTLTFFKNTNNYKSSRIVGILSVTDQSFVFPSEDVTKDLMVPEVYTVASEYTFLDNILQSPETRKIKRWVNSAMMEGFRKLAIYYVREFGAWYFVNKISNFNPDKSNEPVKFELIKMPWARYPELPNKEIISTDEWILENGIWNDSGIWIDSEFWID